jgi:hypothetical protein
MLTINKTGSFRRHEKWCGQDTSIDTCTKESARKKTISYSILSAHNTERNGEGFKIRFDGLMAHDGKGGQDRRGSYAGALCGH